MRLLAGFLSKSNPVDLATLIRSQIPLGLGNVFPENLRRNLLQHYQAEPHLTYYS
jgi:hypothetical protein